MRTPLTLTVLLAVLAPPGQAQPDAIPVPSGPAPTIDGTIEPGEWEGGTRVDLGAGYQAWFMRDGEHLFVALQGEGPYLASLGVVDHQRSVRILHSSASLGTAVYQEREGRWEPTRSFEWVRDQEAFEGQEHWVASMSPQGRSTDMEYAISLSLLHQGDRGSTATDGTGAPECRLAVALFRLQSGPGQQPWRAWPVQDGAATPALLMGQTPGGLQLEPDSWARLRLGAPAGEKE